MYATVCYLNTETLSGAYVYFDLFYLVKAIKNNKTTY